MLEPELSELPTFFHQVFYRKATKERLWEVMTRVIDVYAKESDLLEPLYTSLAGSGL
jgi:hypothetical protein